MMYKSNFVASLKVGGKILREQSGIVALPFGSEYDILLKNLNSRRALAKVTVNGQDATEDTKLILGPNSTLELQRFIKNGNLNSGNRFKFIERTAKIEDHRGIKEDDGLIRVEFWAEKEVIDLPVVRKHYYDEWVPVPKYYPHPWQEPYYRSPILWQSFGCNIGSAQAGMSCQVNTASSRLLRSCVNTQSLNMSESSVGEANGGLDSVFNDAGITVPGSESSQQFRTGSWFATESNSHVIVLQLKGKVGETEVSKPLTVDIKPVCSICGTKNKPTDKFCRECGTAVTVIQ